MALERITMAVHLITVVVQQAQVLRNGLTLQQEAPNFHFLAVTLKVGIRMLAYPKCFTTATVQKLVCLGVRCYFHQQHIMIVSTFVTTRKTDKSALRVLVFMRHL